MTKEWSVRLEATHAAASHGVDLVTILMHTLRDYAAVGSADGGSLELQLSVEADSLESAAAKSLRAVLNAVRKTPLKHFEVVDLEVETAAHFEARLAQPDPEYVGIAELAGMLGVTRARASAIAARRDFPAPAARLAAGPVWIKANLSRWFEEWRGRRKGVHIVWSDSQGNRVGSRVTPPPPGDNAIPDSDRVVRSRKAAKSKA